MPSTSTGIPQTQDNGWLELHEASALLGVSLSTMRRWADAGKVPVYRTIGGHRRFQRHELHAVLAEESSRATVPMVSSPPWSSDVREMDQQEWHRQVRSRPAADRMRGLGQRLLGLLIQHVHSRGRDVRFLDEAGAVGTIYGREAFNASISLHETVKAFLFFRHACAHLTSPATGIARPPELTEAARLQDQIDEFMDAVLLGVLAGYENRAIPDHNEPADRTELTPDAGRQDQQK